MDNNALRLAADDNAEQACFFSLMRPDMSTCIKKKAGPGTRTQPQSWVLYIKPCFPARCFHTLRPQIRDFLQR